MTILFGSQSGTAETYAYELGKEVRDPFSLLCCDVHGLRVRGLGD